MEKHGASHWLLHFRSVAWVKVTIVNTRQQPGHPSVDCQQLFTDRGCNGASRELLIFLGSINFPQPNSKNATYTGIFGRDVQPLDMNRYCSIA